MHVMHITFMKGICTLEETLYGNRHWDDTEMSHWVCCFGDFWPSVLQIFQVLCEQSSKSLSRLKFSAQKIRFEFAGCFFLRFFFITCLVLIPLWLKCVASQPETAVAVGLFLFSWVSKDLAQRIPPGHAQILTRDLALALGSRVHSLHRFKDFKNDWWNDLHFWTSREGRVDLKRDSVLRRVPHWVCILLDCTLVLNVARGKWFFQNRNGEKTIRKQFLFQVFVVFFLFSFLFFPFLYVFSLRHWSWTWGKRSNSFRCPDRTRKTEDRRDRTDRCCSCLTAGYGWLPLHCLHWDLKYLNSASNFGEMRVEMSKKISSWISFQAKIAQNITNSVHRTRVARQVGKLGSCPNISQVWNNVRFC